MSRKKLHAHADEKEVEVEEIKSEMVFPQDNNVFNIDNSKAKKIEEVRDNSTSSIGSHHKFSKFKNAQGE
jgi:hypothetical protein